jgi:hypothetical protein
LIKVPGPFDCCDVEEGEEFDLCECDHGGFSPEATEAGAIATSKAATHAICKEDKDQRRLKFQTISRWRTRTKAATTAARSGVT